MKLKKAVSFFVCAALLGSMLAGCGQKSAETVKSGAEVLLNGDEIYPVQCEDTLTYWMSLNSGLSQKYENFGDTPLGKELERQTGIKVEYIHGQAGQSKEQFNILMASGELPDMTQYDWAGYPGGGDKAIEDSYIIDLNTVSEYMPAFTKYFSENPDNLKKIQGDSGAVFTTPFIRSEQWLATYQGLLLRGDWLEECGLEIPKTLDEFENVLITFKDKYGCTPLATTSGHISYIMYAYNTAPDFYLMDGAVTYGYAQPEYKKALERIRKWYEDGLFDKDFTTYATADLNRKMLNGEIGAMFGAAGGSIGAILNANPTEKFPTFKIETGPCLTTDGSEIAEFGLNADLLLRNTGTSISANCKNYELAARYLDFGYTEAGHMLYNFGIEGVSYNMIDGEPILSELITNNPEGKTLDQAAVEYMKSPYNGSFIQDARYVEQSLEFEEQREGYKKWSQNNMEKHLMPPTTLLPEELDEAADITAVLKTYVDEMAVKFISGTESLDKFDDYVNQLNKFGLPRLLQMRQSAYERYLKR